MDEKTKVAAILLGGYLLGRTRKAKLALTLAGAIAGKQLSGNKGEMLGQLNKLIESSPEAKKLMEQLTTQLTEAAWNAVLAGATRGIESVGANLQNRTDQLNALTEVAGRMAEEAEGAGDEEAPADETDEAEEADEAAPADEADTAKEAVPKRTSGKAASAAKSTGKKASSRSRSGKSASK